MPTLRTRPYRFLRLPDGRAVQLARPYPMMPTADHVCVMVTKLESGRETDMLLPEAWPALRAGKLWPIIAARLAHRPERRKSA